MNILRICLGSHSKLLIMLYIDLRPRQTCHSKDGKSAYPIGVGQLGWQYGTGLKSHGRVTNWCTGREWPGNCLTIISARWRSNMPLQRRRKWHIPMASYGDILSGWLNYYITRWGYEVRQFGDQAVWRSNSFWRPESLDTRCGRESQHPAESRAPRPPVEQHQENGKETLMAIRVGSICCSSVRSLTPSHTQPFQIKWEVYFSKNCVARSNCMSLWFMYASTYEYTTINLSQKLLII